MNAQPSEPIDLIPPWDAPADHDVPALATERFGPGEVMIGVVGLVRTNADSHTAIHRVLHVGALVTACSDRPRHIIATAASTGTDDVLAALESGGYEPCRLCRRCWPTVAIPEHDTFTCYTRHRLPGKVRNVLSGEAVAVIAELIRRHDQAAPDDPIRAEEKTWTEIRTAFPPPTQE